MQQPSTPRNWQSLLHPSAETPKRFKGILKWTPKGTLKGTPQPLSGTPKHLTIKDQTEILSEFPLSCKLYS